MNADIHGSEISEPDPQPRRVLVTGGSTGIGAAICAAFLAEGCEVVVLDRQPPVVSDIRLHHHQVDLTDRDAVTALAAEIAAEAPLTTIVHNAGVIREKPLEEVTAEDVEALTALHVTAAILLVQAFLPTMKAAGFGRIVLVGSRAALGLQKRTAYAATKSGMIGLMRTWALELGPFGITANLVAPGPIRDTEMFHAVIPRDDPRLGQIAGGVPVRRLGRPADVARAVAFLAAPDSGFITGQNFFVCGGTSVGSITY